MNELAELRSQRWQGLVGIIVTVCAIVIAVHLPVLSAQAFVFDDNMYITDNVLVQNPSWTSIRRFFTEVAEPSTVPGYYQPVTMTSLMVDRAISAGAEGPRPYHRTSLALHVANTALLITIIHMLVGHQWAAAVAGLLFGLHPMTIEPIAWVSERKTLLAAFFAMTSIIFYLRFLRFRRRGNYIACIVTYVLAAMSKPTSLPLPILMLVMDYWPLNRLGRKSLIEKLPLLAVSGLFAILAFVSQSRTASATLPDSHTAVETLFVLSHNIAFYFYKVLVPTELSAFYAYPETLGLLHPMVMAGVIVVCALMVTIIVSVRRTRVVLAGTLFYFIAILPASGMVKFTNTIAADRHVYIPLIGLLLIVAGFLRWSFRPGRSCVRYFCNVLTVVSLVVVSGAEVLATRNYLPCWRNTVVLFEHMLRINPNAPELHLNLGNAFVAQHDLDEAITCFRAAVHFAPHRAFGHNNLGSALLAKGQSEEAMSHLREALRLDPDLIQPHFLIGVASVSQGMLDEAGEHFRTVIDSKRAPPGMVREIQWIERMYLRKEQDDASGPVPRTDGRDFHTPDCNGDVLDTLTVGYDADDCLPALANSAEEVSVHDLTEENRLRRKGWIRDRMPLVQPQSQGPNGALGQIAGESPRDSMMEQQ
jgi:protein O-mannosyl-transferase